MSITDELREYAGNFYLFFWYRDVREKLDAIADRIDAAHEEVLVSSYLDGVFSDGELAENGFMRLPRSIEDKPINEHDKVDWRDHAGTWHENATVVAVCNDGCYVMDGTVFHVHKSDIRHHHAPTVEDVLYESLKHFGAVDERTPEVEEWLHEQAERLTLAGDAE